MSEIDALQLLRDYAREPQGGFLRADEITGERHFEPADRGEMAGKTFVALQLVLTKIERLEEEVSQQILKSIEHPSLEDQYDIAARKTKLAIAKDLRALIVEGLS